MLKLLNIVSKQKTFTERFKFAFGLIGNRNQHNAFRANVISNPQVAGPSKCLSTAARNPFKTVGSADLDVFHEIVDGHQIITDQDELSVYNTDWTGVMKGNSKVVLKPTDDQQVAKILEYCNNQNIAICIQGGNTGLVYGSVPIYDEVILSTSNLNKIISFDSITGTLTCESGCILQSLDDFLVEQGYTVPLDLGAKGSCQIGGNVSTNAGGLHFIKHGSLHGSVLGLEVILATGEKLDLMTSLKKDNTGYDLKHLFIGAEGTLGMVTKVIITCPLKAELLQLSLLGLNTIESVFSTYCLAKQHLGELLSAIEFMDNTSMEIVQNVFKTPSPIGSFPFYMLIEVGGSSRSLGEERLNNFLMKVMNENLVADATVQSDGAKMRHIWSLRERVTEACLKSGQVLKYDLSMPIEHFYTPVLEMRQRFGDRATHCLGFGHLGDGNLHLNIVVPSRDAHVLSLAEPYVYEMTGRHRGSISAEHGMGAMKNQYMAYSKSDVAIYYMKRLKNVFDPKGILNPYKTLPG